VVFDDGSVRFGGSMVIGGDSLGRGAMTVVRGVASGAEVDAMRGVAIGGTADAIAM
jgi:hypothetical protein